MVYILNKKIKIQSSRRRGSRVKYISLALTVLVVLVALGVVSLKITRVARFLQRWSVPSSSSRGGASVDSTKGEPISPTQETPTAPSTSQPGDNKSDDGGGQTTLSLISPTGNFVSDHHVTINTPINSVCNTAPGARCTIKFTSGSSSINLPTETTDRSGAAYWNGWTPQSIGLAPGTWQIQAIASLGGQAKASSDVMGLVVMR